MSDARGVGLPAWAQRIARDEEHTARASLDYTLSKKIGVHRDLNAKGLYAVDMTALGEFGGSSLTQVMACSATSMYWIE